jgi:hypothetical protein
MTIDLLYVSHSCVIVILFQGVSVCLRALRLATLPWFVNYSDAVWSCRDQKGRNVSDGVIVIYEYGGPYTGLFEHTVLAYGGRKSSKQIYSASPNSNPHSNITTSINFSVVAVVSV